MLTANQQSIIENSLWVVNTALKRQGLSCDEDLRQQAILYMCKCLQRFDQEKNIKWTTYAYKNVYLYIKRLHLKESYKPSFESGEDLMVIGEKITPIEPTFEDFTTKDILAVCSPIEREILHLKLSGYKYGEISNILNCSISKINKYMKDIREKAKGLFMKDSEKIYALGLTRKEYYRQYENDHYPANGVKNRKNNKEKGE